MVSSGAVSVAGVGAGVAGDAAARLRELLKDRDLRHALAARSRCQGLTPADADDLMQQTWTEALKRARAGNVPPNLTLETAFTYLFKLMIGIAGHMRRANRKKKGVAYDPDDRAHAPGTAGDPEHELIGQGWEAWRERTLEKLRAKLAKDSRGALPLRMLDEYEKGDFDTYKQLADSLGVDLKAVYAARAKLVDKGLKLAEEESP